MAANPELTRQVKDYALKCGVDIVGVASVDRFGEAPNGFHPTDIMKSTRSVITFARKFIMGILDELSPGYVFKFARWVRRRKIAAFRRGSRGVEFAVLAGAAF